MDDNDWQEAGHSGGGGGATVVQQQKRNSAMEDGAEVEDGWGGMGWGVQFFSTFNPTLYTPTKMGGVILLILGGGFCYD